MNRSKSSFLPWWAVVLLSLFSLAFLGLGYMRSTNGLIHAFDTGIYLQLLNNLQSGLAWSSSVTSEANFLGHHFQPIIALLLPFQSFGLSPFSLLLVGWFCSLVSIIVLMQALPNYSTCTRLSAAIAGIALFLHPALASRMYYSFVPEVLALPFLTYLASLLARKDPLNGRDWIWLILSLVGAALCKESLWLTSGWVAILLAFKHRRERQHFYLALTGVACFGIFLFLFLYWMPAHSSMTQYFGLSFYKNSWVDGQWGFPGKVLGALLNILSGQSLETAFFVLLIIPAGLTVLGNYWALAGALPAVGLVLAASHGQIHSLTNHYMLAALPFLAVSSATGLEKVKSRLSNPKLILYLSLFLVLAPLATTFMNTGGYVFQLMFASERISPSLQVEIGKLKQEIKPDDFILIDGNLQPLFSEYRNTKVILGFQGNPSKLSPEDLGKAQHVITSNDLAEITDCRSVKPSKEDLMEFDYPGFYQFCEWLKKTKFEKREYIANRLIDLKITQ